jgi:amino acid adenylation domain-containing protein
MTALKLISKLGSAGIKIWLDNEEQLRFKAPKGALTKELREELVAGKAEVIAFLREARHSEKESGIPRINREEITRLPLSFSQQRIWFLDRLDPGNASYHITTALRIRGDLDIDLMRQAFEQLIIRHESLRTTFMYSQNEVSQVIKDPFDWLLAENYDLSGISRDEQEQRIQAIAKEEILRSFDLTDGTDSPYRRIRLLRTRLVRLTPREAARQEHVLLINMHHIITDGWSLGILVQELSQIYIALKQNKPINLPPLPIQYVDYAHWQRNWLQSDLKDTQLAYWRKQLDKVPVLELPTDYPRPPVLGIRGDSLSLDLPGSLGAQLHELSQQQGKTLFMVGLTAFMVLMARYSGQSDICVGTPVANRNRTELEPLIGCFINTLALRSDLSGNPRFIELLDKVQHTTIDAYANQDVPFEAIVEELDPKRDMSYTPFFQVMFSLQTDAMDYRLDLPGLVIERLPLKSHSSKFDLMVNLVHQHGRISIEAEFNSDLFTAKTIQRLLKHFETLLQGIAADPEIRIHQLPLLTETENRQFTQDWSSTATEYPNCSIHQVIERQTLRTPNALAVCCENQQLNYRELNMRANQLAHYLIEKGVEPDQLVGICMERSVEMSIALLAVLKAGGAYVPFDPNFPSDRLSFMMDDTQVSIIITQQHLLEKLPHSQNAAIQRLCIDDRQHAWLDYPTKNLPATVNPRHLFNVIYTSGSTGRPKGVMVPHGGIVNRILWMQSQYPIGSGDNVLQKTPYSFDVSVWELFWPLMTGATLVYAKPEGHKDPDYLRNLIIEKNISTLHFVPSMLGIFLQSDAIEQCQTIRRVFCSGEALPVEFEKRFFQRLGFAELHNLYGPTEASVDVSYFACQAGSKYPSVPIGKPVANTQLHVLDPYLQPVPQGVIGELHIGGVQLARGYLNRQDLTSAAFIDNPFFAKGHPSARLYKTGDLARYLPDGNIEYIGRIDHQVKVRGFRIELGEIETVLSQQKGIKEAVVSTCEHAGSMLLVGYVVTQDQQLDTHALRKSLKQSLPEYMVPGIIMRIDKIPLSANGKADRKALPQPDSQAFSAAPYVAPRNLTEQRLAEIWSDALQIERIGIHDNFFEIGGQSLLATQVVARIREAFDRELPLRALFDGGNIEALASFLDAGQNLDHHHQDVPDIVPMDRNLPAPMSFAQERLWIIDQLMPGNPAYNIPAAMCLRGQLDIDILQQAFTELVRRHASLRTNFSSDASGQGLQIIAKGDKFSLEYEEFPGGDQLTFDAAGKPANNDIQLAINAEAEKTFDLVNDSLLRAKVIRLNSETHLLLVTMHHIISDAWSISVLQDELITLYESYKAGEQSPLPELGIQYADYAYWQRQWLLGDVLERHLSFWVEKLSGAPAILRLPYDRPRPPEQTFNGAMYNFDLPADLLQKARQFSKQQGITLYTTLFSAYNLLLSRYANQQDICIGTPVSGRKQAATENTIGYFVNTVVIRTALSGNPSALELVERVNDSALAAFAHQDIPIERVLDALDLERNISYPPVAQLGFSFINEQLARRPEHFGGLAVSYLDADTHIAKYDMTLIMIEQEKALSGQVEFNTDLFDCSTIETMMQHYLHLLAALLDNPQRPIDTIDLLSTDELYQTVGVSAQDYEQILPLTAIQRDLYLNAQVMPETLSNTLAYTFPLPFAVDRELWRQANQHIADSQQVMRTDILPGKLPQGDVAYQCIAKQRDIDLAYLDLSAQFNDSAFDDKALQEKIHNIIYQPFSFKPGSLISYHLIKLEENKYLGIMRANHCISDGISQVSHGLEVLRIYNALAQGQSPESLTAPADLWQQHVASNRKLMDTTALRQFWQAKLANCEALDFPVNLDSSEARQINLAHQLDPGHWEQIKLFTRKQRITPALYFKCLYGLLIKIYCRAESDFHITEFSAGRDRETATSLGCFFQQFPFVFPQQLMAGNSDIEALLNHAKQFQRDSRGMQYLSPMAQGQLAPQGRLAFMYNYSHFYPAEETLCGHSVSGKDHPPYVENAVQLVIKELGDTLQIDLHYQSNCFDDLGFVQRLEDISQQILKGSRKLSELNYITAAEKHLQTTQWNDTFVALPPISSVQSLVEAQVAKTPDQIAVISDDIQLTYRELNEQANRLAHHLHHLGVGADTRVGVCMHRSAEFMVAILAVIKAGGAYVPMDASYPRERLAYMLEDADVPVLLTQGELQESFPDYQGALLCLDTPSEAYRADIDKQSTDNPTNTTESSDLLYVIYTSGSTGKPKGAGVVHRGEINLLQWYTREFDFDANTRNLIISATGFDLTQKNLWAPLISGGAVVLPRLQHYDSERIAQIIHEQEVTLVNCAPSAFYQIVEDSKDLGQLNSLRYVIFGGEPIRLERLQRWLESEYFQSQIVNNYGPTECTDIAAFHRIEDPLACMGQSIPVGRPNDNVQLFVLNEDFQLLPGGLVGELCIAGDGVGRGYLNHDQLNLEKFTANPFGNGQLYRSGDLMRYLPDGKLEFVGRKDFQVKLNGLRIELGEIEHALRQLDDINDALVTVIDDSLVAYLTSDKTTLDEAGWPAILRQNIPAYMVPTQFIVLPGWPLTPNGKINRSALPTPQSQARKTEYVAPRNEIEEQLAAILCSVLNLDKVGVFDDFFEIGGHSLAASRAIVQIRETFDIDIPLNVLFEMTTIDRIATYIKVTCWAADSDQQAQIDSTKTDEGARDEGFL